MNLSAQTTDLSFSNLDRINPPVNVTAEIEGTYLSIQWEKPISAFPSHCFEYEVKIYNARKNYFQVILQIIPIFDDRILLETFLKFYSVTAVLITWN